MNKYNSRQKYGMGWFNESHRHSLARQGIKTGQKINYSTHRQQRDAVIGGVAGLLVAGPIGAVAGAGVGYGVGSKKKRHIDNAKNLLTVEAVKDSLPHGSGINGDWNVYEKDGQIIAENYYDTMTENGMYDRPAYFKLIIDKKNPKDFKLHFKTPMSQYLNHKYQLRDYLENSINDVLDEELKKKNIDYSKELLMSGDRVINKSDGYKGTIIEGKGELVRVCVDADGKVHLFDPKNLILDKKKLSKSRREDAKKEILSISEHRGPAKAIEMVSSAYKINLNEAEKILNEAKESKLSPAEQAEPPRIRALYKMIDNKYHDELTDCLARGLTIRQALKEIIKDKKLKKVNFSIEAYKGRGVFDPSYEDMTDSDGDGIPDLYDLHPMDPNKGIEWSKKKGKIYIFKDPGDEVTIFRTRADSLKDAKERLAKKFVRDGKVDTLDEGLDLITQEIGEPEKINYAEQVRWDWAKKTINMDKVADAFYDENWYYFEKVFGKKPKNHLEAEKIMEDYKKTHYSKPEVKGQQLRIRMLNPKRFTTFKTKDVGKKGKLQLLLGHSKKEGWKTQSYRLNLDDYKSFDSFKKDLMKIKISPQKREQSLRQALRYYNKR